MKTFTVYRQGRTVQIDVEIGSKSESALNDDPAPAPQTQPQDGQQGYQGWSGGSLEDFFNFFYGY